MRQFRSIAIVSLGLSLATAGGCATFMGGGDDETKLQEVPQGPPSAAGAAESAGPPIAKALAEAQPANVPTPPDQAVRDIPGLDPAVQAQLIENLKQTPPEMWPQILQSFRAAAAAKAPRREPATASALPTPAQTLDGATPPGTVKEGSGLAEHAYDPRETPPARAAANPVTPRTSAAQSLASAFAAGGDPHAALAALAELNDPLDETAPVQQVNYEETSQSASDPLQAIDAAIRELEQPNASAAGSNQAARRQIELRLLYLAAGRRDDALRPILGMTTAEQEYWSSQLYALSTWLDTERIPAADRRASETLVQLDRARAKLAEIGALQVRNPQLCTRVDGYGAFTKFKEDVFKPKQEVVLYVELENFRSDATDTGFRTALVSRYRILDAQGREVVMHEFPTIEETCQNRRRDYYVSFRVQLPARIYDGRHTLQLTVEDTLGKKVGQTSIEFTIKE